jgi:hypothetical protein
MKPIVKCTRLSLPALHYFSLLHPLNGITAGWPVSKSGGDAFVAGVSA